MDNEYYSDVFSEYALLGTICYTNWDMLPDVYAIIGIENPFYDKQNFLLWKSITDSYMKNCDVTMESATGWDGLPNFYKEKLIEYTMANIAALSETIKVLYLRRKTREKLLELLNKKEIDIVDMNKELQDYSTWLELQTTKAGQERSMTEIANDEMDRIDKIRSGVRVDQFRTYYMPLDEIWGLLDFGFYLIAGEEKAGKSRFAVSLMSKIDELWRLNQVAYSQVYFMMEMQDVAVNRMLVANKTGIGTGKLKLGNITNAEYDLVTKAQDVITKSNMIIVDKYSNLDVDELSLLVDFYKRKYNAKYFYIDHLLYLTVRGKFFSEREKWGAITQRLKSICKQKKVIMFVLCHLTKSTKDKPTKKDMLTFGTADKDCYGSCGLHRANIKDNDGRELMSIIGFHSRDGVGGEFDIRADLGKCQFGE